MSDDKSKSLDIFGIKPVGDALHKATAATLDGIAAVLSRICLPAAEEFGLAWRDRVSAWRTENLKAITQRAQERLEANEISKDAHASPRLVHTIVEEGSWADDAIVQDLWAGLLSSSCTDSGDDDSNLIFSNLLSQLTKLQARILKFACENAKKSNSAGLVVADDLILTLARLKEIADERDVQRLDREMDCLRELGLISLGFQIGNTTVAYITPTTLALHMYVRCQGSRLSPIEWFALKT